MTRTPRMTMSKDLPTLVEGDDVEYPMTFTDPAGDPIDISGWTVSVTVADRDSDTPVIEKDITTHDDAAAGETSFAFTPSDTSGLSGSKRYDIQVVRSDGSVKTVVLGTVRFLDGVTDRSV